MAAPSTGSDSVSADPSAEAADDAIAATPVAAGTLPEAEFVPPAAAKPRKVKDPARVTRQVGAVPLRVGPDGTREVLLVTSRETRRWVVPKGNKIKGQTRSESAATEALEEAGVFGTVEHEAFDSFLYWKRHATHFALCRVELFILRVAGSAATWKERGQRDLAWVPLEDAAELVVEPGLQAALTRLAAEPPDA